VFGERSLEEMEVRVFSGFFPIKMQKKSRNHFVASFELTAFEPILIVFHNIFEKLPAKDFICSSNSLTCATLNAKKVRTLPYCLVRGEESEREREGGKIVSNLL
jgi:hypothetical protein